MACLSGKTRVAGIARCAAIASARVVVIKAQGGGCQGAATVPAGDDLASFHASYEVGSELVVFRVVAALSGCATPYFVRLLMLGAATSIGVGGDECRASWLTADAASHQSVSVAPASTSSALPPIVTMPPPMRNSAPGIASASEIPRRLDSASLHWPESQNPLDGTNAEPQLDPP